MENDKSSLFSTDFKDINSQKQRLYVTPNELKAGNEVISINSIQNIKRIRKHRFLLIILSFIFLYVAFSHSTQAGELVAGAKAISLLIGLYLLLLGLSGGALGGGPFLWLKLSYADELNSNNTLILKIKSTKKRKEFVKIIKRSIEQGNLNDQIANLNKTNNIDIEKERILRGQCTTCGSQLGSFERRFNYQCKACRG